MNKKILLILAVILAIGLIWSAKGTKDEVKKGPDTTQPKAVSENDKPTILSTKPDPLENNIVSANETIEITFNKPLQNSGEFKLRIEPKIAFKINLSSDRKTAQISFPKPLELGTTYTMFIGPDTKFDGTGNWGMEKIYHFKTITYRGV